MKTKILLAAVNAKYIHSNLAVYSLRAYAGAHGYLADLAEFTINQSKDEMLKGIFRRRPEVLCISCYIWNISMVEQLVRELAKILPDMHIWLGGPEVSYDAGDVLGRLPMAAGVMRGEGEETFLELCRLYEAAASVPGALPVRKNPLPAFWRKGLGNILGITYRDGASILSNPARPPLDPGAVPFVYHDLADFRNRIIYYESSRGCPFSCSYCLSSVDRHLRFRDMELVKRELLFFLGQKVPQVKFVDRTFNCSHERAMEIWRFLIAHDNGVTNFHFEIAADLLREDEIELIGTMRPGMIQLEIGVQSTNPRTIDAIHRKMDFAKVAAAVQKISAGRNVHQHLDLIAGLPWEDYDSFARSFNDVYALRPQQLQLGFLKVLKGSFMYEHAKDYGCVYQEEEPYEVLYTRWLPYEDVLRLKRVEEMVEVYYNSAQFLFTLDACVRLFATPFAFYEALGAFYEEKGYLGVSHTRIRRYEILFEFLTARNAGEADVYRQRMLCDLYARENLKSRPAWAPDRKPWASRIRAFYLKEEAERRWLQGYDAYDAKQLARMTHLEVFHLDPRTGREGECAVLFDYRHRDCLTGNVRMLYVDL